MVLFFSQNTTFFIAENTTLQKTQWHYQKTQTTQHKGTTQNTTVESLSLLFAIRYSVSIRQSRQAWRTVNTWYKTKNTYLFMKNSYGVQAIDFNKKVKEESAYLPSGTAPFSIKM